MGFSKESCNDFIDKLGSKEPTPGGGGASAFVGSIAAALANMVSSMTVGKKKYAKVEPDMYKYKAKCDILQDELLALVDLDAEVVQPLADAYKMPADTAEDRKNRNRALENARKEACTIPMDILGKCCEVLEIIKEIAEKGAESAVSDAGVAALCCKAAMQGAALNVYINTQHMTARKYAEEQNAKVEEMLEKYLPVADEIYENVLSRLK